MTDRCAAGIETAMKSACVAVGARIKNYGQTGVWPQSKVAASLRLFLESQEGANVDVLGADVPANLILRFRIRVFRQQGQVGRQVVIHT
jgi:hypothetical protein